MELSGYTFIWYQLFISDYGVISEYGILVVLSSGVFYEVVGFGADGNFLIRQIE